MIIGVMVVMQFIPAEQTNPEVKSELNLVTSEKVSNEVQSILKRACYDCHSHETIWPWYSHIAPAKWAVSNHVVHGRRELNFSKWQEYDTKKKDHKLEECLEAVKEGWMPESTYLTMHKDAVLTDEEKKTLLNFFEELRKNLK